MIFKKKDSLSNDSVSDEITESQLSQIKKAFNGTGSFFNLLTTLRTRRVGLGYQIESGEQENFEWSSEKPATQAKGPLNYVSTREPVPLSELEEALICWAALGPNGLILGDIPVNGALSGLLSYVGRTVPSSSNDLSVELFIINDDGVSIYRPPSEDLSLVEIKGEEDFHKILDYYRSGKVVVSKERPKISWPSSPEGTKIVNATGPGQYNLNRPGSTWFLPIGDVGVEWFNQLLISYEWSGFYLLDPDTNEPAGCQEWIKPGFLEVGFPIPAFDELALMLHAGQVGAIVQNIRLASEALGLGAWMTGSYADDLVLGAYPEITQGLGFSFLTRDPKTNPSTTQTCQGLEGFKESVMVPCTKFKDARSAVEYVVDLKNKKGSAFSREDNFLDHVGGPYKKDVLEEILKNPKSYVSDWAIEAATKTVEYIVNKYGCAPSHINPVRAKISAQVHHIDVDFYRQYYTENGDGYAITPQILSHFNDFHEGSVDPYKKG